MGKKIIIPILAGFLSVCSLSVVNAQEDADGCKDHSLFNRMPNYHITGCEELEFSSMKFPVGPTNPNNENKMKMERVEGKVMVINYVIKEGAKPASGLQILRNFQTAAKQNGGILTVSIKAGVQELMSMVN